MQDILNLFRWLGWMIGSVYVSMLGASVSSSDRSDEARALGFTFMLLGLGYLILWFLDLCKKSKNG